MDDEVIRLAEENFGGNVAALLSAERAVHDEGLKGKDRDTGGDIAAAALAGDHEDLAVCGAQT